MEKLLEEHKIDIKTSRFLILQFEVKNISEMPAKSKEIDIEKRYDSSPGLLEYIDEVCGTRKYASDIENALQNSLEYDKRADDKRQKHATEKICLDKQEDKKQQADEYVEQVREL